MKLNFKISYKTGIDILILLLVLGFLANYFEPEYMFSPTTTTGGDMGSHVVLSHYLHNDLLPRGWLRGWYPNWLGGMPIFQFYFVLPYLMIALLSYLIPHAIAFKLVSVSGIFLLPVSLYLCLRILKYKFPAPILAATFSLFFLFLENFSQWGGNIKSTLAGQFPHGISLAFLFVALAATYAATRKYQLGWAVLASVLWSLVVLNHIYTFLILVTSSTYFLFEAVWKKQAKSIIILLGIGVLCLLLSGFWLIPLLSKLAYTSAPKDVFFGYPNLRPAYLAHFLFFYICSVLAVLIGFIRRDGRMLFLLYSGAASIALIMFGADLHFLYVRFIPYLYILPLILSAIGISEIVRRLRGVHLIPIIFALVTIVLINAGPAPLLGDWSESNKYIPQRTIEIQNWIRWNYRGLESKNRWVELKDLLDYIRSLPQDGRIDVEHANYNFFGTPRVFEASPMFTEKPVLEALIFESSLAFPFFFYIQEEVSERTWWPGFSIKHPGFNLSQGLKDLELYNVQIFLAYTSYTKEFAREHPGFRFLKTSGDFEVYAINEESTYVRLMEKWPILVETDDWRPIAFNWMESGRRDVFLAFTDDVEEVDRRFFSRIISEEDKISEGTDFGDDWLKEMDEAESVPQDCQIQESVEAHEINIKTNCISRPLLVKVNYFPNWKVEGASKVYLVTPTLMLIFPEQENVRLYFGWLGSDIIGVAATWVGIIIIVYLLLSQKKRFRKRMHDPLVKKVMKWRLTKKIKSLTKRIEKSLIKFWGRIAENKRAFAIILVVFFVGAYILQGLAKDNSCNQSCRMKGFGRGVTQNPQIDFFQVGFNYPSEQQRHNFRCTALCDESRPDFVYVINGEIEFTMKVAPNQPNNLTLTVLDSGACRTGDLYVNERFVKKIKGDGTRGRTTESIILPREALQKQTITIRITHSDKECYGWDIYKVKTEVAECNCV
ncbi:MAG: 6-pyruvoyl-tetrahydropterin synthase-related protein [Candidatus Altiarchaeota archaeon]